MFCPRCGAEYRPGFTRCADCEVDLVEEPGAETSEAPAAPDRLVLFRATRDPDFLGLLVERLEEERIPYAIQAGTALALLGGGRLAAVGEPDGWEAHVLVLAAHRLRAEELARALAP